MTNPNYTAIMLLIDRSGSMASIQESAQAGINEFVQGQASGQAPGKRVDIRICQFDTTYEVVAPLSRVERVKPYVLVPRNGTALLDAMGRSISEFGTELAAMPERERPGVVIVAVMTDGEENSSFEYDWETVKTMVQRQENIYRWQILYLGANQDAITVGGRMGVRPDRSMTYAASAMGTRSSYNSVSDYVTTASTGAPATFTEEDREAATKS